MLCRVYLPEMAPVSFAASSHELPSPDSPNTADSSSGHVGHGDGDNTCAIYLSHVRVELQLVQRWSAELARDGRLDATPLLM